MPRDIPAAGPRSAPAPTGLPVALLPPNAPTIASLVCPTIMAGSAACQATLPGSSAGQESYSSPRFQFRRGTGTLVFPLPRRRYVGCSGTGTARQRAASSCRPPSVPLSPAAPQASKFFPLCRILRPIARTSSSPQNSCARRCSKVPARSLPAPRPPTPRQPVPQLSQSPRSHPRQGAETRVPHPPPVPTERSHKTLGRHVRAPDAAHAFRCVASFAFPSAPQRRRSTSGPEGTQLPIPRAVTSQ